jgi:hypothetical protein
MKQSSNPIPSRRRARPCTMSYHGSAYISRETES